MNTKNPSRKTLVNAELEKKLLVLCIGNPHVAEAAQKAGGELLFSGAFTRKVWAVIEHLLNSAEPILLSLVRDHLNSGSKVAELEGLMRLYSTLPVADAFIYLPILVDYAERRRLAEVGQQLVSNATNFGVDRHTSKSVAATGLAEGELNGALSSFRATSLFDGLPSIAHEIERYELSDSSVSFPWPSLDAITGPLKPSDVYIVAARPAMGKTTFALNVATHAAKIGPVIFFSLEMSKEQLALKIIAAELGKDIKDIVASIGALRHPQGRIMDVLKNLYIFDTSGGYIENLRAIVMSFLEAKKPPVLIVVDYLQLMGHNNMSKNDGREREISLISRGLKLLASEAKVPILALSQLNRRVEERAHKIPVLSDLRDSGSLEQDAHIVMFLYREDYYFKKDSIPGLTDVLVLKNRMGPTGQVSLRLNANQSRFGV